MTDDTIAILGIPIHNLDMTETVDRIFEMVDAFQTDTRARQVATVNVDFVVNTLAWGLKQIRHPELLAILRKADLVTADGMPMVWTSKLLGTPLKERVTGADLVPRLAQEAARRGKSIYFLGGRGDVGKQAAEMLQQTHPDLIIAGTDSPFVLVEGEQLLDAEENDQPVVDHINRSKADILLIGFGNPKQEVWFDRNRHRLNVPVSIGIGGTYEFILGTVARAPLWMQKAGLEWIFRITQDPKRLWKRYVIGFMKFGLLILPSIAYYKTKRLLFRLKYRPNMVPDLRTRSTARPGVESAAVVTLPISMDAAAVMQIKESILSTVAQHAHTILDFEHVDFIDSSGLGMLLTLWRTAGKDQHKIFFINISSAVRRLFELSRVFDLFKDVLFDHYDAVMTHIQNSMQRPAFYCLEALHASHAVLRLVGELDAAQMAALDLPAMVERIGDKDCILDLAQLTFVDSSGIMLFLKIQRHVAKQGKMCVLCGMQEKVRRMFQITKLVRLFKTAADTASAEQMLTSD